MRKITIDKELLFSLYKKHRSVIKIGKQLGHSSSTISNLLSENKICFFKREAQNKLNFNEKKVITLYEKTKNINKVAKILNCSSRPIIRILKNNGIKRTRKLDLDEEEIIRLYKKDKITPKKIAKRMNCSKTLIYNIFKKNNIKMHKKSFFLIGKISPLRKVLDEKKIIKMYVKDNMGYMKISKMFKCSTIVIQRILKDNNIPPHTIQEMRAKQIIPIKDTSIELKLQEFLKKLGIEFFTHQYMKIEHSYQCDILIPSMNLIIEADGDYWHYNKKICKKEPNEQQVKQQERDNYRTKELLEKGYNVIRLWENKIKKMNLEDFKNILKKET